MKTENWLLKNTTSLAGKTVAVSGATGGIGRELCRYLLSLGASCVLLDRNRERSAALQQQLRRDFPRANVQGILLDLENMHSVQVACEQLKKLPLYRLIHNAGAYAIPRHPSDSGYNNVFQINCAAPYYITKELLPTLRRQEGAGVVAVGSIAHTYSVTDEIDIDFSSRSASSLVYGNAKRRLMFSLQELFADETKVSLSICHPGITFTNITAHYPKAIFALIKYPMKIVFMPPRKAALSIVKGCFDTCSYGEWIGPRTAGIWGVPEKTPLPAFSVAESKRVFRDTERWYAEFCYSFRR